MASYSPEDILLCLYHEPGPDFSATHDYALPMQGMGSYLRSRQVAWQSDNTKPKLSCLGLITVDKLHYDSHEVCDNGTFY
jgi:hypothetical protein